MTSQSDTLIATFTQEPKKASRVPISKTMRFEVFKRDGFACQYCGARAPDVTLECDHLFPVVHGGKSGADNLITACVDCNRGKGARPLAEMHEIVAMNKRKRIENEAIDLAVIARRKRRHPEDNAASIEARAIRLARRRRQHADHKREVRRANGAIPRAEYEANSMERLKPWEAFGISQRTWYNRGKPMPS